MFLLLHLGVSADTFSVITCGKDLERVTIRDCKINFTLRVVQNVTYTGTCNQVTIVSNPCNCIMT